METPSPSPSPSGKILRYSPSRHCQKHSQKQWNAIIRAVAPAVLVLETEFVRSFDDIDGCKSDSTAFVIDKYRGIALTNQHCVGVGPATFTLRFINGEAVPAHRIFVDPIHDFAFLRFDPTTIEYMDVVQLELHPDGVEVGQEIMVLGNDSCEKLLTCPGIITGWEYHDDDIEDMDAYTFYNSATIVIQSGSSGSPVIDIDGNVVGLNSNGEDGIAGFFMLHKIVRAFKLLQNGFDDNSNNWTYIKVPRKSLGASFCPVKLEDLIDQGIITEEERLSISEEYGNRVFQVKKLYKNCDLSKNDLLLEVNHVKFHTFDEVESILDDWVEEEITVKVALSKGYWKKAEFSTEVFDLEDCRPLSILDISGSSISTANYRMALRNETKVGNLVVTEAGASFDTRLSNNEELISINGKVITCFNDFIVELKNSIKHRKHLQFGTNFGTKILLDEFYRWISLPYVWNFSKENYTWRRHTLKVKIPNIPLRQNDSANNNYEYKYFSLIENNNVDDIKNSIVKVHFRLPKYIAFIHNLKPISHWGTGFVIYKCPEIGVVLVPRVIAPLSVGRVVLRLGDRSLPGKVFYVDELHGFTLICYGNVPSRPFRRIQEAKLSPEPLCNNEKIRLLCHENLGKEILTIDSSIKCSVDEFFHACCEINNMSGLITEDGDGRVKGLFVAEPRNSMDVKYYPVLPMLKPLSLLMNSLLKDPHRLCAGVNVPRFQANLEIITIKDALYLGLPYRFLKHIFNMPKNNRQFLKVKYCLVSSNAAKVLEPEDVLLSVNGQHVSSIEDLDMHVFGETDLTIKILRGGFEQYVCVEREFVSIPERTSVLFWCGVLVQDIPRSMYFNEGFSPRTGVVVTNTFYFAGNNPRVSNNGCCFLSEINGMEVTNLEDFIDFTRELKDGDYVFCKMLSWRGVELGFTYHLDFNHFPTIEATFDDVTQAWNQIELSSFQ